MAVPNPLGKCESCIAWPCPDFDCLPCQVQGFTYRNVLKALNIANIKCHRASSFRFPGCRCVAEVRICVGCRCTGICQCGRNKIDLKPFFGYPVHNITQVNIDGGQQVLDGWRLSDSRWLSPPPDKGWPIQDLNRELGEPCTWSICLNYGLEPPPDLVSYRDEIFFEELKRCAPSGQGLVCDTEKYGRLVSRIKSDFRLKRSHRPRIGGTIWQDYQIEIVERGSDSNLDAEIDQCINDWISTAAPTLGDLGGSVVLETPVASGARFNNRGQRVE